MLPHLCAGTSASRRARAEPDAIASPGGGRRPQPRLHRRRRRHRRLDRRTAGRRRLHEVSGGPRRDAGGAARNGWLRHEAAEPIGGPVRPARIPADAGPAGPGRARRQGAGAGRRSPALAPLLGAGHGRAAGDERRAVVVLRGLRRAGDGGGCAASTRTARSPRAIPASTCVGCVVHLRQHRRRARRGRAATRGSG